MIILIGNKADLEAQRDVTYEEAKQFAEENGESHREQHVSKSGKEGSGWKSRQERYYMTGECKSLLSELCELGTD